MQKIIEKKTTKGKKKEKKKSSPETESQVMCTDNTFIRGKCFIKKSNSCTIMNDMTGMNGSSEWRMGSNIYILMIDPSG